MKTGCGILCIMLVLIPLTSIGQDKEMPSMAREYRTSQFDEYQYNQVLADALLMQLKADSLKRMARDRRIHAREVPDEAMKKELAGEALRLESEARLIQAEADRLFSLARRIREEDIASRVEETDLILLKTVNGIKVYAYRTDVAGLDGKDNLEVTSGPDGKDDMENVSDPDRRDDAENVSDSNIKDDDENVSVPDIKDNAEVAPEAEVTPFDILAVSPYGELDSFPPLKKVDKGLVYHIQMGAFSNPAAFDEFRGIVPVFVEVISDRNLFKYYAGMFTDLQSVTRALERIRAYGFEDAFIVAFFDGIQITTEEAREIEYAEFRL